MPECVPSDEEARDQHGTGDGQQSHGEADGGGAPREPQERLAPPGSGRGEEHDRDSRREESERDRVPPV
jgi:hypothetical protein